MNKDECISKFVAYLIIAFPVMAMCAFLVELFTIETFIEISKNHGSLIAGLLAVVIAFYTVKTHYEHSKKLSLDQEKQISLMALFEIREHVLQLYKNLSVKNSFNDSDVDEMFSIQRQIFKQALIVKSYLSKSTKSDEVERTKISAIITNTEIFYEYLIRYKVLNDNYGFDPTYRAEQLNELLRSFAVENNTSYILYNQDFQFTLIKGNRREFDAIAQSWQKSDEIVYSLINTINKTDELK